MQLTDQEVQEGVAAGTHRINFDGCSSVYMTRWAPGDAVLVAQGRKKPGISLGPVLPYPLWNAYLDPTGKILASRPIGKISVLVEIVVRKKTVLSTISVPATRLRPLEGFLEKRRTELERFDESYDTLQTHYQMLKQKNGVGA